MRRTRDFRRHQTERHMWRRLKEDRNQHYNALDCPCWTDGKAMARFKEQPKLFCRCWACSHERHVRRTQPALRDRRQMLRVFDA